MPRKIIIDTDPGQDDAVGILLALASPEVEVLALTTVAGNVPLDLTSPEGITVLAATITLTPGTVTADVSQNGNALLVHCLHAPDPDAVVADIKSRYEARLLRIFS